MTNPSASPSRRLSSARLHCKTIRDLMAPTEKLRPRDAAMVMISADLWKHIYLNARKGAK